MTHELFTQKESGRGYKDTGTFPTGTKGTDIVKKESGKMIDLKIIEIVTRRF